MTRQKVPEWFNGEIYEEGGEVTNPYSGCSCWLTPEELSMYDFIKGCEMLLSDNAKSEYLIKSFYEGLWWFKDANYEAYMILLD